MAKRLGQIILLLTLCVAQPARAAWSCVTSEGRLKSCKSAVRCQKFFAACQPISSEIEEDCADPRCRFVTEAEPSASKPALLPKPALPPLVPHPSPAEKAESPAPSSAIEAQAERKLEEIRKLVVAARAEDSRSKIPGPSGLSPEQEARLYGSASTVRARMAPADRKRELEELRANPALRLELRRQLASRTGGERAYNADATTVLNSLLNECDTAAKPDGMKPLSPQDAFGHE